MHHRPIIAAVLVGILLYVTATVALGGPASTPASATTWSIHPARDLTRRAIASLPPLAQAEGPLPDGGFTFVVMGDNRGNYEVLRQLIERANRHRPAFIMNTGDLVAEGKLSEYLRFLSVVKRSHSPYFTIVGNHDVGGNGRIVYRQIFGEENYTFDYGGCRFVALDNADGSFPDERLAWLDQQLMTPLKKILFLHKPPAIGNWLHPFQASPWTQNADRFMSLVSQRGVSRVFLGHIHAYEEKEIGGVRYVVTGGAGAPLEPGPTGFFHSVTVTVTPSDIRDRVERLDAL
jgi:predicted phosphodiesterase